MMRFSFLLFLLQSVSVSVSAVTSEPRLCIQGGEPPAACPLPNQHHWDDVACRWICNQPVQCLANPCDGAVESGACSREACVPDYSIGCNFICNTPTPTGVKCLIDPCQNAAREGICPFESCTADYSKGCNFKCSKCTLTCATVKCAGGTECTIDQQCQAHCQPIATPTPTPTPTCSKVCLAACITGFTCQADENGCKACRPNPTTSAPTCSNVCKEACIKGYECGRNAQGCAVCVPSTTPTPVVDPTPITCNRDVCLRACIKGFSCQTDSNGCKVCLPDPTPTPTPTSSGVQCFVDPCQNAARDGICPFESCIADYSKGCNFKCSKCSLTCATVKCAGGTECVQDEQCKIQCKPIPTPTPTPTPSCPRICTAMCRTGFSCQTDRHGCKACLPDNCSFVCKQQCVIGMECHPDEYGCTKCVKTCTTNQGNTIYDGDKYFRRCAACTCGGVCSNLACQGFCFDDNGKSHTENDVVPQPDGCNTCSCTGGQWKCTQKKCGPIGSVVLSAGFTLTSNIRTAAGVVSLLRAEASAAGVDASFIINKADITLISTTTNGYKWNVKVAFKGASGVREASWNAFKVQLIADGIPPSGVSIAAAASAASSGVGSGGTGFVADDLESAITTTETMTMQSCENGQDIPAEQQCQDAAVAAPVGAGSGSGSSTSIAVIIAPIVGGVLLLALVGTAAIVLARRRTTTIKTMHSAKHDTTSTMTANPAVTATNGEQRV